MINEEDWGVLGIHGSGLGIKEECYLNIKQEGVMGILNEGGSFAGGNEVMHTETI
jgi:6-phosphofructokinase